VTRTSNRLTTAAALLLTLTVAACDRGAAPSGTVTAAKRAPLPEQLGIGHPASPERLAAIDVDANPADVGLPPGQGTYDEGQAVYAAKCASCHGAQGEGQGSYPKLVGAAPRPAFPFGNDVKLAKTIGNYWPYSTTVYDYIHRAMPLTAPGSLPPDEVYGLVAYLLAENQIVPRGFVATATSLPAVVMPAKAHFVRDDRADGRTFR
jgi:S-disulfanyl-L-cysteine oxidoreductase SoxD